MDAFALIFTETNVNDHVVSVVHPNEENRVALINKIRPNNES
jgi:hypothetical protein